MLPRIYFAVSLMSITTFIDGVLGFYCYTGDGEVIRTKLCPSIGENFSDICFKKFGDPSSNEVQRGCFNRAIATLITENESLGCLEIPPKYGRGTICLCDAELCNSATKTSTTTTTLTLATSLLLVVVVTIKTFFL